MARFTYSSAIDAPVQVVFAFHEKPEALEILTPPRRKIEVVRREGNLEAGEVEFRFRFGPLWLRWHARHTGYENDRGFVDEQVNGPFRYWRHRHLFTPEGEGTRLTDEVEFGLPGGVLADALLGPLVRMQLRGLFDYRHRVTRRIAERMARQQAARPA